ncbi:bifunctional hydroxymethylpyrimidine kinase/phosphomethylpyrimidine kinase [Subtercola sp. RTI3]|uniref:bifunctional hydroxymethylpyrimidine kinase/phosphomethylpyrimidine kinase n=1 Tax=Subtercola sp. RTI3 TaxID=3048639 RepID=UPI002B229D78|nr:bifunctional hydroxymethylpyrimidine kinase/phosphomethylpyrimidine kinase [Subtercola sp. RTI3]
MSSPTDRPAPFARAVPRVLSIAGTDPTGGAGIQADLKSIAANGGYGMAVVTALVAQNTHGVRSVHTPPPEFLREQLDAVSDDVVIDAVKIGMLGEAVTVAVVRGWLDTVRPPIVVLDPVMVSTSGHRLLAADAEDAVRRLVPFADLVTPNLPELAVLVGAPLAPDWATALEQARRLSADTGAIVLAKGGHLEGALSPDALVDASGRVAAGLFESTGERVATVNTHGTGCSLSSALATRQAQTLDWVRSLTLSKHWLLDSLRHADALEVGTGRGPISHLHALWSVAAQNSPAPPDQKAPRPLW